jgi:hypothetical protein
MIVIGEEKSDCNCKECYYICYCSRKVGKYNDENDENAAEQL